MFGCDQNYYLLERMFEMKAALQKIDLRGVKFYSEKGECFAVGQLSLL
jgi:hypothetical protein